MAMDALAQMLNEHIGDRGVPAVADEWGVPASYLYDILRSKSRVPRKYLDRIAAGLKRPLEDVLLAAHGIPPTKEKGKRPANGRRRGKAFAST